MVAERVQVSWDQAVVLMRIRQNDVKIRSGETYVQFFEGRLDVGAATDQPVR